MFLTIEVVVDNNKSVDPLKETLFQTSVDVSINKVSDWHPGIELYVEPVVVAVELGNIVTVSITSDELVVIVEADSTGEIFDELVCIKSKVI